jgi:hypothetical protein
MTQSNKYIPLKCIGDGTENGVGDVTYSRDEGQVVWVLWIEGWSCSRAVMQSCSRAVMQSCSRAVVQSCSRAVLQLCSRERKVIGGVWVLGRSIAGGTLRKSAPGRDNEHYWPKKNSRFFPETCFVWLYIYCY